MSERARLANIPMPETALKCPRCESTNTKFCYFNNYSLSQPRHFCKTCRRYWTRGGALRNVPVGGGCRRNKRSKSSSSKSPASSGQTNPSSSVNNTTIPTNGGGSASNLLNLAPQFPPLRFTPSDLTDNNNFNGDHMGLNNYSGITTTPAEPFLLGGGGALLSSDVGCGNNNNMEQWRLHQIQQFPFLGGLDTSSSSPGIYQFHGGGESGFNMGSGVQMGHNHNHVRPKFSGSMLSQVGGSSVKMEENHPELNLSRQLLGGLQGNDQWNNNNNNNNGNGANWTELSSFSSSSTSNPL
ncbi:hypothetical protein DH2020_025985 [Rehmannia glutinosa]|uniref:Dof zinc finger protein n=1 Tax=Rehmannia glutinosa TaxID=99300 RepID=A0ABR0W056_REHGL